MHKEEFIRLQIQEALGDECTDNEAKMVFDYARKNDLIDSDMQGNWGWTDEARQQFSDGNGYVDERAGYIPPPISVLKIYHLATKKARK